MLHPDAPLVVRLLLLVHIAAGTIGLLAGPIAFFTAKGRTVHRRSGTTFVAAMLVVAVTAQPLAVAFGNAFLGYVGIFSGYLAWSGARAARAHVGGRGSAGYGDWIAAVSVIVAGIALAAMAARDGGSFRIVLALFALIATAIGVRDLRTFARPAVATNTWLLRHIRGTLAAYIAAVSAFSAVNFSLLPVVVRWLWPTVIGTYVIFRTIRRYRRGDLNARLPAAARLP